MDTLTAYLWFYFDQMLGFWYQLDHATRYNIWLSLGAAGLLTYLYVCYRLIRWILGHQRFRGTWYTPHQMQQLVNILDEDQASGRRVMQHDEIRLLRQWKYGTGSGLGFDRADGFDLKS